jgi:hypothetical protein
LIVLNGVVSYESHFNQFYSLSDVLAPRGDFGEQDVSIRYSGNGFSVSITWVTSAAPHCIGCGEPGSLRNHIGFSDTNAPA